jgi:hypothetical protein
MYHWHRIDPAADDSARTATAPTSRTGTPASTGIAGPDGTVVPTGAVPAPRTGGPAARALQVALDRRDNGGDLGAARDE